MRFHGTGYPEGHPRTKQDGTSWDKMNSYLSNCTKKISETVTSFPVLEHPFLFQNVLFCSVLFCPPGQDRLSKSHTLPSGVLFWTQTGCPSPSRPFVIFFACPVVPLSRTKKKLLSPLSKKLHCPVLLETLVKVKTQSRDGPEISCIQFWTSF